MEKLGGLFDYDRWRAKLFSVELINMTRIWSTRSGIEVLVDTLLVDTFSTIRMADGRQQQLDEHCPITSRRQV